MRNHHRLDYNKFIIIKSMEITNFTLQVLQCYGVQFTRVPCDASIKDSDWMDPTLKPFLTAVDKLAGESIAVFSKHQIKYVFNNTLSIMSATRVFMFTCLKYALQFTTHWLSSIVSHFILSEKS